MSTQIIGLVFQQWLVFQCSFIPKSSLDSTDTLAGFLYPVSLLKDLLSVLLLGVFFWLFLKFFSLPYCAFTDYLSKVIILSTFFL